MFGTYKETPYVMAVQELCESRGARPGLSVLTSLLVSVDVKLYIEPCFGIGLSLSLICQPTSEDIKQHYIYHRHTPFPPFSPSLISLMVSVDVKHHVYFNLSCLLQTDCHLSTKGKPFRDLCRNPF